MKKIPTHIAIIMDGNGRWAKQKGLPRVRGHEEGVKRVRDVVNAAEEAGIKYLTLYAFSSENWKRPALEVSFLMGLLSRYIDQDIDELIKKNVCLHVIGELEKLPEEVKKKVVKAIDRTKDNTGSVLTLALSYSARNEIADAARQLAEEVKRDYRKTSEITPELLGRYLYTKDIPDPDLLIRTSGEYRISNFLLWQISYSELYFTEVLWPDFTKECFLKAVEAYQKRERRYGLTKPAS